MGKDPDRDPPFFFTKPADAIVESGATVPFPPLTKNLHHEVELVVAIGKGGANISLQAALAHVWGYAVGIDLTAATFRKRQKPPGGRGIGRRDSIFPRHARRSYGYPLSGIPRRVVFGFR